MWHTPIVWQRYFTAVDWQQLQRKFRLRVDGTNLIACRCQCSLARHATAVDRSQCTFWSLARHLLCHLRLCCPAGELALLPPPLPSLQQQASSLASAGELSQRARLPEPSHHSSRWLAVTAIAATQAFSPSSLCCRQASLKHILLSSQPPPPC